jgi:hypothetical protein
MREQESKRIPSRKRSGLTVGMILGDAFNTTIANIIPFFIIALILQLPKLYWDYVTLFESSGTEPDLEDADLATIINHLLRWFVWYVLGLISQAAMVFGTISYLSGHRVSATTCLSEGLSRIIPVIGVAFLLSLLIGLGTLFFIIPGIVFVCVYYVAIPVAVMETPGLTGALRRSAALTNGHRWTLFFTILVLFLIAFLIVPLTSFTDEVGKITKASWMMRVCVNVFIGAVGSVCSAVAYVRLRERKEGVDLAEMTKVFD